MHETPPAQRSPSRPDPERPRAKAAVPPGHKTFLRENRHPAQAPNVPRAEAAVPPMHETPPAQRSPSRPDPERPRAKAAVPPGHKTFLRENRPPAQALNVHAQRLPPRPDTKRSCGHGPARHAPSACIYPAGSASAVRVPADTPRNMPAPNPRQAARRPGPMPGKSPHAHERPAWHTPAQRPCTGQRPGAAARPHPRGMSFCPSKAISHPVPKPRLRGLSRAMAPRPSLPTGALRANASRPPRTAQQKGPVGANRPPPTLKAPSKSRV